MNVALVKNAEHNVNGHERGEDEERLAGQGSLECLGRPRKISVHYARHADALLHLLNGAHRVANFRRM